MKRKTFRSELLELWMTTTKESRPDMFNFYADLVGHDMVIDTGKAIRPGANSKPRHYKQKVQKLKCLSKTWVLTENNLKIHTKKNSLLASTKKPRETHCPYMQELTTNLVTRSTKTEEKLKKRTFRSK